MFRKVLSSVISKVLRGGLGSTSEDGPLFFRNDLQSSISPDVAQASGSPAVRAANPATFTRATTATQTDYQN